MNELPLQANRVTLWSRQAGTGRARVEQPLQEAGGQECIEVAFSPVFLAEVLKVLEGEEAVRLELTGPDGPAVFRAGEDYLHVLMPLPRE